ncbi:beta-ketoacyl synthase [Halobaculum sp. MBLA0143]|uniref:beta-ketoacyl-[acyl-carrier-protein] synthase family protein n=1 Tax=Halobaculum sp. MBLA0143 TaxID=3079933 RepID=UPI0035238D74
MLGDDESPVVTGVGLLTAGGESRSTTWETIRDGDSRLTPPTEVHPAVTEQYDVHVVGRATEFDPQTVSGYDRRTTGRYAAFALDAAEEALIDAALDPDGPDWTADRVGVSVASVFGGLDEILAEYDTDRSRVSSYLATKSLGNLAAGHVGMTVGARGPNRTQATACAAGTHALDAAVTDLRRGRADVMLVGGAEAVLNYYGIAMTAAPRAYTSRAGPDAVRPFDESRDGLALGEGAAVMIVETAAHARDRGVEPYARVTGVGATADAHHPVSPPTDGHGLQRSMQMALSEADVSPDAVDYVNTHGTGTVAGDTAEANAVETVLGEDTPITSVKGAIGHTYGAAGAIDAAVTALSVDRDTVPATANVETPDPEITPPVVTTPTDESVDTVVSNSAGFGGTNGSIVFETPDR